VVHFTVDGTTISDTATADESGAWTFNPNGLAEGQHTIVATETDTFGNSGTASLTFTLDTAAPSDVITSDVLNKNGSFTLKGTSEGNSTIQIYDGSTLLGSTLPNSSGQWSFTTGILSSASAHNFNSTATDVAGNVGSSGFAVYGTKGNDTITGSAGNDLLTGGGGSDKFVFLSAVISKDVITDFQATGSNHDTLQFDHTIFANAHLTQVGKDVVITFDANDTVTLVGVRLNQLTANDFDIV
jgi:Ca2+-binding RTX toxin-like protein